MKTNRSNQRNRQSTPKDVLDALLRLVEGKFYQGDGKRFNQDKKRILVWALLWPAREFFNKKEVAVPAARYQELLTGILIEAAMHADEVINYRPAWLARVIQSHFEIHEQAIYDEAKAVRNVAENALLAVGQLPQRGDGLVEGFTTLSKLLDVPKAKKRKVAPATGQLNLL